METKKLNQLIATIKRSGAKLDTQIQEAALGCLIQLEEHGNSTPLNMLWEAMPKGSRRNALGVWACKYGKARINTGKDKDAVRFKYNKTGTTDLDAAAANPWYGQTKERALEKEFSLQTRFAALLRDYKKHINADITDAERAIMQQIEQLLAIRNA